ncbi:MAG: glycosyltransferase family 2 protein [Patescibacteria group bacterium]
MHTNKPIEGVSILVPVYNEKVVVLDTLSKLTSTLNTVAVPWEIILINDGSSDGSAEIIDDVHQQNVSVLHHLNNRGYGASLKTGITASKYPWILITDADGTYPVDRIPEMIKKAESADMVVGARRGTNVHKRFFRSIGRDIVRRFASYVAGAKIDDINSGLRIFKKEDALRFWHLFPDGFSFTTTITVASFTRGNLVTYMPIDYYKRTGKSSIKPVKDFIGFMSLIAKLSLYFRPLRVFIPVSLFLFVLSWATLAYGYFALHEILDATWSVIFITSIQTFIFGFVADMIVKRFYTK